VHERIFVRSGRHSAKVLTAPAGGPPTTLGFRQSRCVVSGSVVRRGFNDQVREHALDFESAPLRDADQVAATARASLASPRDAAEASHSG